MADVKEAPRPKTEAAKAQGSSTDVERRAQAPGDVNPLAFMRRFAGEMDHLFEEYGLRMPSFFGRGREMLLRETGLIPAEWSPRVDVSEKEGKFVVRADLPGLSKDDVQVELTGDMLAIRGKRKHEKSEERKGYSYSECSYGSFYRAVPLPEGVDSSKATAEFQNGVLEVVMPSQHRTEAQPRRLEIREAK